MNWEKTSSIKSNDYGKVRVKTHVGSMGLNNVESQQLSSAVGVVRTLLPYVLGQMVWPRQGTKEARNARFAHFFLGAPTTGDYGLLYSKLELVLNGLNNKVNVKVAPGDGAYGYVGFQTGVKGALRGVFSPRHNLGTRGGKVVSRGDIHIDRNMLGNEALTVITLIHEALHKFASLADHGNRGYIEDDGSDYWEAGLTKAEALNNADSVAWFCYAEHAGMTF